MVRLYSAALVGGSGLPAPLLRHSWRQLLNRLLCLPQMLAMQLEAAQAELTVSPPHPAHPSSPPSPTLTDPGSAALKWNPLSSSLPTPRPSRGP
jgi:hypothetical protein